MIAKFLLLGHICWTNPGTIDDCKQIIIRDLLSPADCNVQFTSRVYKAKVTIEKKGLSLTQAEAMCYDLTPGVDKFYELSYHIK